MKHVLIVMLFLYPSLFFSQTVNEFKDITSYFGKTFKEFELGLNKRPYDSETSFGLESKVYKENNYDLLIKEHDDNKVIDQISFLSKKGQNNIESWYEISKSFNSDKSYVLIDTFINSEEKGINKKGIKFDELIKLLRENSFTDDLVYYTIFKKDNVFYHLNVYEGRVFFEVYKYLKRID